MQRHKLKTTDIDLSPLPNHMPPQKLLMLKNRPKECQILQPSDLRQLSDIIGRQPRLTDSSSNFYSHHSKASAGGVSITSVRRRGKAARLLTNFLAGFLFFGHRHTMFPR
jgi:hypothetical protein